MKHVVLIGSFGATNIGDEAILESTLQYLSSKKEELAVTILSHDPEDTIHRYGKDFSIQVLRNIPFGFRSILFHGISFIRSIKILRTATVVLFPGGGLFTDKESPYAAILWWLHFFFFYSLLGKKVILLGQSFGPLHSWIGKWCFKFTISRAQHVYVRDEESFLLAKKTYPSIKSLHQMFDPVCYANTTLLANKIEHTDSEMHIAVSLRPWKLHLHVFTESFIEALRSWSKDTPNQKIVVDLIPMQYKGHEDVSILQEFGHHLHKHGIQTQLHTPQSYKDVLQILSQCTFAIGMRLHFLILAAKAKLPLLAITYSSKINGFLHEVGIKRSLSLSDLENHELLLSSLHAFFKEFTQQDIYLDVFEKKIMTKEHHDILSILSKL